MTIHSRNKGANAEREVRDILREEGFECHRDGQIYGDDGPNEDLAHNIPGVHIEVKRRETLAVPAWCRQAEEDARGRVPWVVFRQSRQPWRVVVPFTWLLRLTFTALAQRAEIERLKDELSQALRMDRSEYDEYAEANGDAAVSG